jgi:hypothetical protein
VDVPGGMLFSNSQIVQNGFFHGQRAFGEGTPPFGLHGDGLQDETATDGIFKLKLINKACLGVPCSSVPPPPLLSLEWLRPVWFGVSMAAAVSSSSTPLP